MTTEREQREAARIADNEYNNVVKLPERRRLKSVDEIGLRPRIRGLAPAKRSVVSLRRPRTLARTVLIIVTLGFLVLASSVEISCRVNGDPNPNQDWLVGYALTPMIDAGEMENCRINTREYWKARSVHWLKSLF